MRVSVSHAFVLSGSPENSQKKKEEEENESKERREQEKKQNEAASLSNERDGRPLNRASSLLSVYYTRLSP